MIPYLDAIAYKVLTKDISLDIPTQEVITRDNAVITTNAIAFINVIDPQKAVYGIVDFRFDNRFPTRAGAIRWLLEWALRKAPPPGRPPRRS